MSKFVLDINYEGCKVYNRNKEIVQNCLDINYEGCKGELSSEKQLRQHTLILTMRDVKEEL